MTRSSGRYCTRMPAKRLLRLVATALLLMLALPLLAAAASEVLGPCCEDCPPAGGVPDEGPCKGDPLLVCCDEEAAPAGGQSVGFPQQEGAPEQAVPRACAEDRSGLRAGADDLAWLGSPHRLSVVLRL